MNASADALQLELDGVATGGDVGDLLAVVGTLRAAAQAMPEGPGLRARRGAVLAAAHGPNAAANRGLEPWLQRRPLSAAGAAVLLALAIAGAAAAAAGVGRLLESDSPAATERPAPSHVPVIAPPDDDRPPGPVAPTLLASPDAVRPDDEEDEDHAGEDDDGERDDSEDGEDTDAPERGDDAEATNGADESPPHDED